MRDQPRAGHAVVTSTGGKVIVKATSTDTPQITSISGVDYSDDNPDEVKQKGYAVAISVALYNYDASAYIGKYAEVDAATVITVHGDAALPYDIKWADVGQSNTAGAGLIGPILGGLISKLNPNIGIQNGFFTSWSWRLRGRKRRPSRRRSITSR
jgi:hypothetical protein